MQKKEFMFVVIGTMIMGVVIGYLLRRMPKLSFIKSLPNVFIFLLLFSLGISVGSNQLIMNSLSTIGVRALIIALGAVLGSIALGMVLYRKCFSNKENEK